MGRAFDLERRKKPQPTPTRSQPRPKPRGLGGLLLISLIVLIVLLNVIEQNQTKQTNNREQPPQTLATQTTASRPKSTSSTMEQFGPPEPTDLPTAPSFSPSSDPATAPPIDKTTLAIRILNGSDTPGAANKLKNQLENQGFSIRTTALAKTKQSATTIYYQTGQAPAAKLVSESLTDRTVSLVENSDQAKPDDILIIVGNN